MEKQTQSFKFSWNDKAGNNCVSLGVGPLTVTTDADIFKGIINKLSASGGGDIPELSLSGLQVLKSNREISSRSSYRSILKSSNQGDGSYMRFSCHWQLVPTMTSATWMLKRVHIMRSEQHFLIKSSFTMRYGQWRNLIGLLFWRWLHSPNFFYFIYKMKVIIGESQSLAKLKFPVCLGDW